MLELYKKYKEDIRENGTLIVGLLTIIFTIGSFAVKFVLYSYQAGIYDYWNLPHEFINISDLSLSSFFINGLKFAYIAIIFIILFDTYRELRLIWQDKSNSIMQKIGSSISYFIFTYITIFILIIIPAASYNFSDNILLFSGLATLFSMLIVPCIYHTSIFSKKREPKVKNDADSTKKPFKKSAIKQFFTWLKVISFICAILFFVLHMQGYQNEKESNAFRVVESGEYVIIASYKEDYILCQSKCDFDNSEITIDKDVIKIVDIKDVESRLIVFDNVYVESVQQTNRIILNKH